MAALRQNDLKVYQRGGVTNGARSTKLKGIWYGQMHTTEQGHLESGKAVAAPACRLQ